MAFTAAILRLAQHRYFGVAEKETKPASAVSGDAPEDYMATSWEKVEQVDSARLPPPSPSSSRKKWGREAKAVPLSMAGAVEHLLRIDIVPMLDEMQLGDSPWRRMVRDAEVGRVLHENRASLLELFKRFAIEHVSNMTGGARDSARGGARGGADIHKYKDRKMIDKVVGAGRGQDPQSPGGERVGSRPTSPGVKRMMTLKTSPRDSGDDMGDNDGFNVCLFMTWGGFLTLCKAFQIVRGAPVGGRGVGIDEDEGEGEDEDGRGEGGGRAGASSGNYNHNHGHGHNHRRGIGTLTEAVRNALTHDQARDFFCQVQRSGFLSPADILNKEREQKERRSSPSMSRRGSAGSSVGGAGGGVGGAGGVGGSNLHEGDASTYDTYRGDELRDVGTIDRDISFDEFVEAVAAIGLVCRSNPFESADMRVRGFVEKDLIPMMGYM
jgi:hypothetical protein